MVMRLLLLVLALALAGCAAAPRTPPDLPLPAGRTVYVEPFETAMVPHDVEEEVFDLFVDRLNEKGAPRGLNFIILSQGAAAVDPAWLKKQYFITGEIFGYVQESGCCSTALRLKGRARLTRPGEEGPALQVEVPRDVFFDHDYSTLEAERRKLVGAIATALADRLVPSLPGR